MGSLWITEVNALVWLVATQFGLYAVAWAICGWLVPEERRSTLYWCAFCASAAVGMVLASLRDEQRGWWPYVGSTLFFYAAFVTLWRGGAAFVRLPQRNLLQAVVVSALVLALVYAGPGVERAPLRVFVSYAGLALLTGLLHLHMHGPLRAQFGRRAAWGLSVPAALTVAMYLARATQQVLQPDVALEMHRQGVDNTGMLIGYLVGTAMFNFAFLGLIIIRLVGRLRELTQRDPLTGLYNRRAFDQELTRQQRQQRPDGERQTGLALLLADLDHFKRVNDTHGHVVGDQMLVHVARLLREGARSTDTVARLGGEEFAIVMADTTPESAAVAAERLRALLAATPLQIEGSSVPITVSIGLAVGALGETGATPLLRRADAALYRAKAGGRDRVCLADAD